MNKNTNITRNLFNKGPVIIIKWHNSKNWPIQYISPNVLIILGYDDKELVAQKTGYKDLVYHDDYIMVAEEISTAVKKGDKTFQHKDYRIVDAAGKVRWVQDVTTIIQDEDDNVVSFICYVIDITERKRNDEELQQFKAAIQQANHIIYITDNKGEIEYVNPAFVKNIGYSKDEVIGKTPSILN